MDLAHTHYSFWPLAGVFLQLRVIAWSFKLTLMTICLAMLNVQFPLLFAYFVPQSPKPHKEIYETEIDSTALIFVRRRGLLA